MNEEHPSPDDRMREPEPADQAEEQLAGIERHLRRARPRPPRLDAALVEQLAGTAADEAATRPRVALRSGRGRGVAVLAGTWTCGAVAGALAMFLVIGGEGPRRERPTQTVQHETQAHAPEAVDEHAAPVADREIEPAGEPERTERPARPSSPGRVADRNGAAWAMGFEPFGGGRSPRWPDDFTLRAGMHLGHLAAEAAMASPLRADTSPRRGGEQTPAPAAGPLTLPDDPIPHAATTRERLLEELLREMSGLTL
jgi:hypothetical protein